MCCHLGAREHYAVPRALQARGRLRRMITDAWVKPGAVWARVPGELAQRLSERFHPELAAADVEAFTLSLVAHEVKWRAQSSGWDQLMHRNRWFGQEAAAALQRLPDSGPAIVFAHSYCAREVFSAARARGWITVLGQIDPGEEHCRIVERAAAAAPDFGAPPVAPPPAYFDAWRDECRLADAIIVNSEWARDSLIRAGVTAAKLHVVPLAYEPEAAEGFARSYPTAFTTERPLRVLFVGHVAVAKGAAALLEAMPLIADVPAVLSLVGAETMTVPGRYRNHPAIQWIGPLSRREVMRHYRESDVLVFPSRSDGFGMVQVEAQGWRLPIIASRSCGRVVQDGVNGLLLDEVSAPSIAAALRRVAAEPRLLAAFARGAAGPRGGLDALGAALVALEP